MARKFTKKLIEMMEEGSVDPEVVARAALNYMSESDVEEMALDEGFVEEDLDEDDDGDTWLHESGTDEDEDY